MSDGRFAEFWAVYPKKRARRDALKAWRALKLSDEDQQAVIAAVRVQSTWDDWRKSGGQFVPYPATWLRGERWLDEELPTTASAQTYSESLRDLFGRDPGFKVN